MAFGGFYKGEKKKTKKGKQQRGPSMNAPVFTLPEVITKKKNSF